MSNRELGKFVILPYHSKKLLFEAWLFQVAAGLLLKLVPFRKIPNLFPNPEPRSTLNAQRSTLEAIKWALQHTSRYSIWRNKCLVQSLAARWILKSKGITSQLSLGVKIDEKGKMIAHAWLKAGDFEVVERKDDYTELFLF